MSIKTDNHALNRAIQIQEERKKVLSRRLPKVVRTRTVAYEGRIVTQCLLDLGPELGRGKCCWVPPLPVSGRED